jgi:hypothetical protein
MQHRFACAVATNEVRRETNAAALDAHLTALQHETVALLRQD